MSGYPHPKHLRLIPQYVQKPLAMRLYYLYIRNQLCQKRNALVFQGCSLENKHLKHALLTNDCTIAKLSHYNDLIKNKDNEQQDSSVKQLDHQDKIIFQVGFYKLIENKTSRP